MGLEQLARSLVHGRKPGVTVEDIKRLTDCAISTVRSVAGELRPAELDNLGLAPAVERLLQAVAQRSGARVKLDADMNGCRLLEPHLSSAYRLVAEPCLISISRAPVASDREVI